MFATVLPASTTVGRDVLLVYQGLGAMIHSRCVIGDCVIIGSGVTLGGRNRLEGIPIIGDGVQIGTGAKVLGPVTVGDGALIGANAVVLHDVPPNAVVIGVPARVVRYREDRSDALMQVVDDGTS